MSVVAAGVAGYVAGGSVVSSSTRARGGTGGAGGEDTAPGRRCRGREGIGWLIPCTAWKRETFL